MCGRYQLALELDPIAAAHQASIEGDFAIRYNVAPTQIVPVVRQWAGQRSIEGLSWGFRRTVGEVKSSRPLVNARAETIAEKPTFKESFFRRRCVVPASGFYEWQHVNGYKVPHLIRPNERAWFGMAGIWARTRTPRGVHDHFAIITCPATGSIAEIHHRMPVVLSLEEQGRWLDPASSLTTLHALLTTPCTVHWEVREVSDRVNKVGHDDALCESPPSVHSPDFEQQSLF